MKYILIAFLIIISFRVESQSDFFKNSDSLNNFRAISVGSGIALSWSVGAIGMSNIWYSDYPKSNFHTFNDSHNWLQMDKVGHFYTANKISLFSSDLFKWSGLKRRNASILGAFIGLGLQSTLEVMDGTSSAWGFSWSDMTANTLGVASFVAQDLIWEEQRFIFKFSYHPTMFASIRPSVLGSTFTQSFLKDYNGQTYWMSFSPATFFKSVKIPNWLCLSLGYSVDQKLVGDQEVYQDLTSGITYHSQREYLFSLDIDFSKIDIKKPWLKTICKQLNHVKIPFPALIYSNNKFKGYGIYF
jgi:hypothetical protein